MPQLPNSLKSILIPPNSIRMTPEFPVLTRHKCRHFWHGIVCVGQGRRSRTVYNYVFTEQSCLGFLAGQGCDAFANLFVTPTLTLNLNTSAYRPHALQVLEACGGTVDTDRRHHEWY